MKITNIHGTGIPLRGDNIDTDRIVPGRYLKEITFERMGGYVFYDERFDADGKPKEHPFNDPKFLEASILIVNRNFGCGSSREHAVQAIKRFGVRAIIGESFSPIFLANCTALGILAVQAGFEDIEFLMKLVFENPKLQIGISLPKKVIELSGKQIKFDMPEHSLSAFTGGFWNMAEFMLGNLEETKKFAAKLPYINGFKNVASK
ncbi:Methanogen homoaconitase small subunit [uncultured archaeon]|nr:Methanogen homoaconitase small subunit [uncultured archaeon]